LLYYYIMGRKKVFQVYTPAAKPAESEKKYEN
jgi:hypothetical protein